MQSFKPLSTRNDMYCQSSFFLRGDEMSRSNNNTSRFVDIGELEHPVAFHQQDAVDLSRSSVYGFKSNHVAVPSSSHFGALNANIGSSNLGSSAAGVVDAGEVLMEKRTTAAGEAVAAVPVSALAVAGNGGQFENWGESAMADTSQQTDTSTDVDTEDRVQYRGIQHGTIVVDSMDQSRGTTNDQKALRRLAQNREAARKSRLRKKAYVQQLETSRLKLAQLEQELERARQQGIFIGTGDQGNPLGSGNGPQAFDISYARWLDEHDRLVTDIRSALNSHASHDDNHLRVLVDDVMIHYSEKYKLKSAGAKNDIFHMLSGMWKTPAERCFMWLGGYRSSELLKILANHLEPLTEQQVVGICSLQQSCQQAEDALSQGMEALQQSLVETLSSTCDSGNVADYMGQMALAMGKLATLENFVHQADLLRQQTLQQMHRILTTRQAARALVVIHDYTTKLRALSSLWLARPKN